MELGNILSLWSMPVSTWSLRSCQCDLCHGCIAISHVPPSDFTVVTGAAYDVAWISWVDLPPCIVEKESSFESHEHIELIALVFLQDIDALLCALPNTVLIDSLYRSMELACYMLIFLFLSARFAQKSIHLSSWLKPKYASLHVAFMLACYLLLLQKFFGSACTLPPLHVAKYDLWLWFDLSSQPAVCAAQLQWIQGQSSWQLTICDLWQSMNLKHGFLVSVSPALLHA